MKQNLTAKQYAQSNRINRNMYGLFFLLVIYLLAKGDVEWATANLGIALAFDPFDSTVRWQQRKLYQKVWLLVHLALTLIGFLYLLFK